MICFSISTGSQPEERVIFNLSFNRFIITFAFGLLIILLGFILFHSFRKRNLFEKFIGNERWILIFGCLGFFIAAVSLILISQDPVKFGKFQQLFQNLKPFWGWSFGVGFQTLFFSLVWYCLTFLLQINGRIIQNTDDDLVTIFAIFIALVMAKVFVVIPTAYGPVIAGDEIRYFQLARELFNGTFSIAKMNHSPILYPAMLSIAFLWGDRAYFVVKILNAIYSSSIVFPLYLISRRYFSRVDTLLITLAACVLPYHLLFPRMVMSENLYFPLLLWFIFFMLNKPGNPRTNLGWHLAAGINLGLLELTRYITLALIPPLLISWLFLNGEGNDGKKLGRPQTFGQLGVFIVGILIGDCPWLVAGIRAKVPFDILLGFDITSHTTSAQLTIHNLFIWLILYCCYLILMAAPFLPFFSYLVVCKFRDWDREVRRWIIVLGALVAGFLAASVRHSWRALYNQTIPSRIMGRYILYFTPLFVITALLLKYRQKPSGHTSLAKNLVLLGIAPLCLVGLSYAILFENWFHLHDGNLIKILGSVDGAYIQSLGLLFFIFLYLIYGVIIWQTWEDRHRLFVWACFGLYMVFYLVGIPKYYKEIYSYQDYQYIADAIIQNHRAGNCKLNDTIQILTPPGTSEHDQALMFNTIYFNNYEGLYVTNVDNLSSGSDNIKNNVQNIIISESQDLSQNTNDPCREIDFNQHKYWLNY